VQANGSAALVTITQLQPITVIFTIAEDYIADVVKQMQGQKRLSVDALDREQQRVIAHGELLSLDNAIDPTTGTVKARAIFANASTELFPNQFVNAKLLVRTLQKVPLIPSAAVQRNADESYVYTILPDGTVQSKSIKILATDGEVTAVTGLDVGTTLVADGFDRIQNGVKVTVKKPSSTE
jgi:multidrug efflux system membrane fusion protein